MKVNRSFRLIQGGNIDRSRPLSFQFEGRIYLGFAGDTLASALLANGVRLVGRSFKYHRPRGIFGVGVEEPNALIQLGEGNRSTPNLRATEIALSDGLVARAVNCWPSVRFDVGAINNLFSRFLTAGFYYKTFMWPSWHLYEGFIRRAAGLGKVAPGPDPDRYDARYATCDILVVGSGPAGLAAARAAAAGGARVMLVEHEALFGGQLRWGGGVVDGRTGPEWIDAAIAELRTFPDVTLLTNSTVTGYFDDNALTIVEDLVTKSSEADGSVLRCRQWQVNAGFVILATGAIERPLVFNGNDRPGVMLASAVRRYIAQYAVRPGNQAVFFTNNDTAYLAAKDFHNAGGVVGAIADTRKSVSNSALDQIDELEIPVIPQAKIIRTSGNRGLHRATIVSGHSSRSFPCDLLAVSGGYNPTVHLFSQSGGSLAFDSQTHSFRPAKSVQAELSVGAAAGVLTLSDAIRTGHEAGTKAATAFGFNAEVAAPIVTDENLPYAVGEFDVIDKQIGKAFVDMQNDVTVEDMRLAARENFTSVEHLKRYTTLGMATDQGKTSNVNAVAIMAQLTGGSIAETGTTKYRFPYVPTALGAFAGIGRGEVFRPLRQLPLHDWHIANGALMEEFGGWLRPCAYPKHQETRSVAEQREAVAARNSVNMFDGTPLGKIEVRGPDSAQFLDFIYANKISSLKVGKVRYGLLLNELGVIIDDGVCARLSQDHFLVGTSSAGADRIAAWLEEWLQCEFPQLDVLIAPVTTSWAVITIVGPRARDLLQDVGSTFPLSAEEFPHMSIRCGEVGGVEARVARVSYTGELSYEISVPAKKAPFLWDKFYKTGNRYNVQLLGIDALNVLRLEKGYLHIGGDTDGTTTPLNVGWDHVLKRQDDFLGKRSLLLPINNEAGRLQIIGLMGKMEDPLPVGAHIVKRGPDGDLSDGFVTSSVFSPMLGRGVALALIHGGRSRIGEQIELVHLGNRVEATIVDPVFFDQTGARLNA